MQPSCWKCTQHRPWLWCWCGTPCLSALIGVAAAPALLSGTSKAELSVTAVIAVVAYGKLEDERIERAHCGAVGRAALYVGKQQRQALLDCSHEHSMCGRMHAAQGLRAGPLRTTCTFIVCTWHANACEWRDRPSDTPKRPPAQIIRVLG